MIGLGLSIRSFSARSASLTPFGRFFSFFSEILALERVAISFIKFPLSAVLAGSGLGGCEQGGKGDLLLDLGPWTGGLTVQHEYGEFLDSQETLEKTEDDFLVCALIDFDDEWCRVYDVAGEEFAHLAVVGVAHLAKEDDGVHGECVGDEGGEVGPCGGAGEAKVEDELGVERFSGVECGGEGVVGCRGDELRM